MTPVSDHIMSDGEKWSVEYQQVDENHLALHRIPHRITIARMFIKNIGMIMRYERIARTRSFPNGLSESQARELRHLRIQQRALPIEYEEAVKEEEEWKKKRLSPP